MRETFDKVCAQSYNMIVNEITINRPKYEEDDLHAGTQARG